MNWHTWLSENLRPDQLERLNAYDVEILAALHRKIKHLQSRRVHAGWQHVNASALFQHLRLEMGGISAVKFDEHMRKLEDMALIRRQVVFNREMPEDLG